MSHKTLAALVEAMCYGAMALGIAVLINLAAAEYAAGIGRTMTP